MEVITIETQTFKHLVQRIENMEQMLLAIIKIIQQDRENKGKQPEFISRRQAMEEFQISKTTVDYKVKKYNVSRLPAGGKSLLNRAEFIKALRHKEPFDKFIKAGNKSIDPKRLIK